MKLLLDRKKEYGVVLAVAVQEVRIRSVRGRH